MAGCEFDNGELAGISKALYGWFSKLGLAKQGTTIKSYYLSQLSIDKEQVDKLLKDHSFKSTQHMTKNDWITLASSLKYEDTPHSWYLLREEYVRYESDKIKKARKLRKQLFATLFFINEIG